MNDLLGNPLEQPDTPEEPLHIEEIMSAIQNHQDVIPVQVLRRGKTVKRYLSECKPEEIIRYIADCVRHARMPSVEYTQKREQ